MHSFHLVSNAIILVFKNYSFRPLKYSLTASWTFSFDENFIPLKGSFKFEKNKSQAEPNQDNKQFKARIMDFSHRLYG